MGQPDAILVSAASPYSNPPSNRLAGADAGAIFALAVNGGPRHGHLILRADGAFTYHPDHDYIGPDEFHYTRTDADGTVHAGWIAVAIEDDYAPVLMRPSIDGTHGNDVLTGGRARNVILGHEGDDVLSGGLGSNLLYGGAGNDTLGAWGGYGGEAYGGDGDDTLWGSSGRIRLVGGTGNDVYVFHCAGPVVVERANGGIDTIQVQGAPLNKIVLAVHVENVVVEDDLGAVEAVGNGGANDLRGAGRGPNALDGAGGDDLILGGVRNDVLLGGIGDDRLEGDDGADTLQGGLRRDILVGGAGADSYATDGDDVLVKEADGGPDTIQANASHAMAAWFENLVLGGSGAWTSTGNGRADRIGGNGAANTLLGRDGDDEPLGGDGNDRLSGGQATTCWTAGTGTTGWTAKRALTSSGVARGTTR